MTQDTTTPIPAAAAATPKDADVIVVGAGLSGLSAARKLHEAGKKVIVLEAKDRVGGKTYSVKTKTGATIELGASWINEHTQPHVTALCREAGNAFFPQNIEGNMVFHAPQSGMRLVMPDNGGADMGDVDPLAEADAALEKLAQTLDLENPLATPDIADLDGMSIWAWYRSQGVAGETIQLALDPVLTTLYGADSHELGLVPHMCSIKMNGGWKAMCTADASGAQYQRTRDGNQRMSTYLASLLPAGAVHLSSPVTAIARTHDTVTVTATTSSGNERFTASAIVLAMGPTLYDVISFSPPLSLPQRQAVDRMFMGYYAKFVLVYARPWWLTRGYTGMAVCPEGYTSVFFDTSDGVHPEVDVSKSKSKAEDNSDKAPSGPAPRGYSLTAFLTGPRGAAWSLLPPEDRKAAVLAELAAAFDLGPEEDKDTAPVETFEQDWADDIWSRGAPCAMVPPGQMAVGGAFAQPDGNMFFAGTENADDHIGYMEGAIRAGHIAAEGVIGLLKKQA